MFWCSKFQNCYKSPSFLFVKMMFSTNIHIAKNLVFTLSLKHGLYVASKILLTTNRSTVPLYHVIIKQWFSHTFYRWSNFPWIPKFEMVFCIFECCWEFSTSNKLFCVSSPINFKGIACCWKLLNAIFFFFCNIFVRHTRKNLCLSYSSWTRHINWNML